MSIIALQNATLDVGGKSILDQVDWAIEPQDRIALVGRNGAGKSSLLKLLSGEHVLDSGQMHCLSGLKISGLTQDVPVVASESVYHFLVKSLGKAGDVLDSFNTLSQQGDMQKLALVQQQMDELHLWDLLPQVQTMATRLGIDPAANMGDLSGGMKRRVLLAAALIANPDLLVLDEPTNHLDVPAIEWLESYLKNYQGSLVLVTHDRSFLSQVAKKIVEIDRSKLYTYDCSYPVFLERREARLEAEAKQNELFDKRLAEEEVWIRKGIEARRTRNEGRVRALKAMREQYKARKDKIGKAQSFNLEVARSGKLVLQAENISYAYGDKPIINQLSLLLTRGDKLGILGPNGCGKTTLVRLLIGELQPDAGQIRLGTTLQVAYFDQLRSQLDENQTVMFNVADGADYIEINGKNKHVASYLREFLFTPDKFQQPVSSLSGGERNRLLLARLFAKPMNLFIMDEPTNDLDIETMELLESMLLDYSGTLILISHDREFLNQVVSSVLVFEGTGQFNEYVGGYDDYLRQKPSNLATKPQGQVSSSSPTKSPSVKLSYNEKRELDKLPGLIEKCEQQLNALQLQMADPKFYQNSEELVAGVRRELADLENKLAEYYARWELLEGM